MKPKSPLPKLPSIGELLSHPRVHGLVERVNQSTIATRAAEFFDEIRSGLAERADGKDAPTLTDLAERFARRMLGEASAAGPWINATGLLLGNAATAAPLAEPALHAMLRLGGEFHPLEPLREQAEALLCQLTGAESSCVVVSFEAARQLLLEADGEKIPISPRGADDGEDQQIQLPAAGEPLQVIDAARWAGLASPADLGLAPVETIADRLTAGAAAVVCEGDGLLGGPRSGLIVGRRQIIEPIKTHPRFAAVAADGLTTAALVATLQLYAERTSGEARDIEPFHLTVPLWQLLSTPLDNLQQRSQRLATLLAACRGIATAEPTSVDSAWARRGATELSGSSWAVALRPATGGVEHFAAALRKQQVITAVAQNALLLDLRSVFPRWDQQIERAIQAVFG